MGNRQLRGNRLYPKKNSGRYYILTLLRIVNEKIVRKYVLNNSQVLDYGCGNMPYKKLFLEKNTTYFGADFSENSDADIHIIDGKLPVESNSFDIVISTQVLEHVDDVDRYLKECLRVLKKGGILLLSTHGHWKYHPDPKDFWRWTRDGLSKVISERGFRIVEKYGLMGLAASGLQLFQDGVSHRVHYRFRLLFFRFIAWFQEKVDRRNLNQVDASVHYIIAEKP